MTSLSLNEETPERTIARLERELEHVTGQLRTEHAMTLDWKKCCIAAETRAGRLQKKVDRLRAKGTAPHSKQAGSDGLHDRLELIDQDIEDAVDAPVPV